MYVCSHSYGMSNLFVASTYNFRLPVSIFSDRHAIMKVAGVVLLAVKRPFEDNYPFVCILVTGFMFSSSSIYPHAEAGKVIIPLTM